MADELNAVGLARATVKASNQALKPHLAVQPHHQRNLQVRALILDVARESFAVKRMKYVSSVPPAKVVNTEKAVVARQKTW